MATDVVINRANLPIGSDTYTELVAGDGGGNYVKAVTLTLCNRNPTPMSVRVALTDTKNIIAPSDFLEYDLQVFGNNTFERSGILVPDGYYLYVSSSVALVTATVWGINEYVAGGVVAGLTITNGGSGYSTPPVVTIDPPGAMDNSEQSTCTKDLGYVIDAAKYDMAIGSNYMAVFTGIRFNFALYAVQIDKLRVQAAIAHTETAIKALANVSGAVETAIVDAYAEVKDIQDNGLSATNALVLPDFNVGRGDWTDRKNGGAQIQANKDFISADVNAWVTNNYSTHFNTYAEAKCTRDSGFILDAMTYDLMYGGDAMMTYMAKSFFDAGVSQLTTATERTVVALAYNHLATVVNDIVQETIVTAQSGNNETQDRSGTGATAAEGTICQNLMQLVEDAITANSAAGIPAATFPDVATSANITPFNDITTDQSTIIANAVAYVAAGIGGDQATATAVVEGGVVTNILVSNPGSQYAPAPAPLAVIAAPGSGTQATADVVIGGQGVHLPTTANLTVNNAVELVVGDGGGQTAKIITLNICNRNKMPIKFKAAIASAQDTITEADYIEFNTTVFGRNAFERTGIIIPDGYYLYVISGADNVTATAWGIREQV